jgi:hypothetical protein
MLPFKLFVFGVTTLLTNLVNGQSPAIPTSSVVYVYIDTGEQALVASVVTANPTMTEYTFHNPPLPSASAHDFPGNFIIPGNLTVSRGGQTNPDTYIMTYSDDYPEEILEACTVFNTLSVLCSYSYGGAYTTDGSPSTTAQTMIPEEATMIALTITAGLEKLASATVSPSSGMLSGSTGSKTTSTKAGATGSSIAGHTQLRVPLVVLMSFIALVL